MTDAELPYSIDQTLFGALLAAARRHGTGKVILEDGERQTLTFGRLILGSLVIGAKIAAETRHGETVGVLLPNVNALPVTLFGINAFGRVAAMLNFTAGPKNLASAARTATLKVIISSRRFIDQAKLEDVVEALENVDAGSGQRIRIIYLEDVRKQIGSLDKIVGVVRSKFAGWVHRSHALPPARPAVVLFTSGTEGAPKGVVLSSRNLVANSAQIIAHAASVLSPSDTMMNPLPMFHSFGLTAGTLMPLFNGIKVVLYPSPLHYKQIPKLIKDTKATVLVATDTFLQGYARAAEADDLASMRFVVAGAERVKEATRAMWSKTGTLILEGYGATECSPVLACNLPEANLPGSVGRLLPTIEHELHPVEGITEGGRLMVRGDNVMLGYMMASNPGVIVPPEGGWHDTGDIVTVDDQGFVSIKGRAKRFAKIGGEMISLAAVESMVMSLWPDSNHVVVSLPDPRKGEQLVLVTDKADADKEVLLKHAREQGFPELWVPRAVLVVGNIPVLGSGKVDLPTTIEMVRQTRPML